MNLLLLSVKMKMIRKCGNLILLLVLNILGKINLQLELFTKRRDTKKPCGYFYGNFMSRINLYSVFTLLKYGPSEIFRYSVTEQYNFNLPNRQVLDKGLDITPSESKTEQQTTHEVTMTTINTSITSSEVSESYDKEDFHREMESRRELKQKVCEKSNKAGSILSSLMERVVYFV